MIHEILALGPFQSNCSILGDEESREGMVVDPGDDAGGILQVVRRHGLNVKFIVVTHGHVDHVGALAQVKVATGAAVCLHEADFPTYSHVATQAAWLGLDEPEMTEIDNALHDGDVLRLGSVEVVALHTPGHTPGSISLWVPAEKKLISGDTLFRESIGRTDLPGGDGRLILESIRRQFLPLADETEVTPGHGPGTTMGHEKKFNYFLQRLCR